MTQTLKTLIPLAIVFAFLIATNFIYAGWTAPSGTPSASNNAPAPINVSSTDQDKNGSLSLKNLLAGGTVSSLARKYLFGGTQYLYGDNSSALYWNGGHDTVTQMLFRDRQSTLYGRVYGSGNGANFGLLDGDGAWSYLAAKDNYTQLRINNAAIMTLRANGTVGIGDTTPDTGLKLDVQGRVGASEYCDYNGANCTVASAITADSDFRIYRYTGQSSSRSISTNLNYNGGSSWVTFYSANKDTADYLCRTKFGRPFGYWRGIGYPSYSGWRPYWNLAIASYDPTSPKGVRTMCTSGSSCYGSQFPYGSGLTCYDIPKLR